MKIGDNLVNQKFGFLTVLSYSHTDKKNRVRVYNCKCDCGEEKKVWGTALRRKNRPTVSCGCYRKRRVQETGAWNKLTKGEANRNSLFYTYKKHAKKRKIEFKLTLDQFIGLTQGLCDYCGSEPNQIHRKNETYGDYKYNGIDRLDSNLPYQWSNCVTCCKTCNYAKRLMTTEEFKEWIIKVYKFYVNQGEN